MGLESIGCWLLASWGGSGVLALVPRKPCLDWSYFSTVYQAITNHVNPTPQGSLPHQVQRLEGGGVKIHKPRPPHPNKYANN